MNEDYDKNITIHELIHALELLEEAYGEGQSVESIELFPAKDGQKAQVLVKAGGAFCPIDLPTEDYE